MLSRLPHPYTRADGIGFVEIIAQRPDERPYAITLDDQLIGVVGFPFHEGELPELGYWLGEPYWGQGIMSEAVKGLARSRFRYPPVPAPQGAGAGQQRRPRRMCSPKPASTAPAKVPVPTAPIRASRLYSSSWSSRNGAEERTPDPSPATRG